MTEEEPQQVQLHQQAAHQPPQQAAHQPPQLVPLQTMQYVYSDSNIKAPSFNWESPDLPREFKTFRRYCELLLTTPTYSSRPGKEIVSLILLWMGRKAVEIFDNWTQLTEQERNQPDSVWAAFQTYFEPKSNFRLARFQLRDLRQEAGEPVDSFLTRMRQQASKCSFANPGAVDDNILDQLIKGTAHSQVRKKLLDHTPTRLTLDTAMDMARTFEATEAHLQQFRGEIQVHEHHKTHKNTGKSNYRGRSRSRNGGSQKKRSHCLNCGLSHARGQCPAKNSVCNKCGRTGHWGKVCLNPPDKKPSRRPGNNRHDIPLYTQPSDATLTDYNGNPIEQHGTITMPCKYGNENHEETFYIANVNGPVIFGLPTCTRLGLVKMQCAVTTTATAKTQQITDLDDLIKRYPNHFNGIGNLKKMYRLILEDNAKPTRHPPRKAQIQLREKLQKELKRMVDLDVIRPVDEPTDWVSSITYVIKEDGSLRICLDPRDINKALRRGQHHTPTMEELSHKFTGATVFTKLDAKSGYWAVPLDPASQVLTTFNSPFGRYCFKRLPFGLKTSQDVFQHAMDEILQDLPGVVSIADDITIFGRTEEEHDENLIKLMKRAQETGLVFNPSKCKLKAQEVTFFGNIYSKTGVKPDPKKVEAINKLKEPSNKQELQTFLGMITYLSAYIPRLSDCTHNLRQLLQKDADFQWHNEHQQAFENLKELISNANALQYFDPTKPTVVQVDASLNALGAALVQDNKVIAYAAKSLTGAETRYANNERELLACVFGAERFHTYLYGAPFTIESDHQSLEMITKKSLSAAPA